MRKKSFEARLMELHCRFLGSLITKFLLLLFSVNPQTDKEILQLQLGI